MPSSVMCVFKVALYLIFMATLGGRHLIFSFSEAEQERICDLPRSSCCYVRGMCFKFRPSERIPKLIEQGSLNWEGPGG